MTTITRPRALPHKDTPAPEAIHTTADVIEIVRRSNHATAFAGWTVATITMGLIIQTDTLRSIESFSITLLMIGLLIPVVAATARTGVLLVSAGRAVSVVGGEAELTGAAADTRPVAGDRPTSADAADPSEEPARREAWDRLRSVITSALIRDALARRALRWAYGSGAAFLAWSMAVALLAGR
ncbi:MAG TPA: hypothetical protein VH912_10745 [Streptosporangiaceae bacterium]|jgi:hypothetical protein